MSDDTRAKDDMMIEDYQPFSAVGLLLLIISVIVAALAIINAQLAFLSMFAAIASIVFLVRLHVIGMTSGRRMVAIAMMVSLAAFTATVTYRSLRHNYLQEVATNHAQQWLDLVIAGNFYEPLQLTRRVLKREPDGTDLKAALGDYKDFSTRTPGEMARFATLEPEVTIRELGPDGADYTNMGVVVYQRKQLWKENFHIHVKLERKNPDGGELGGDRLFAIIMERQHCLPPWNVQWHVAGVVNISPEIPRKAGSVMEIVK